MKARSKPQFPPVEICLFCLFLNLFYVLSFWFLYPFILRPETFRNIHIHTLSHTRCFFPILTHKTHTHTNIIRFCEMYQIKDADYSFVLFLSFHDFPRFLQLLLPFSSLNILVLWPLVFFFFCGCTLPRVALGFCFWNHWDK